MIRTDKICIEQKKDEPELMNITDEVKQNNRRN